MRGRTFILEESLHGVFKEEAYSQPDAEPRQAGAHHALGRLLPMGMGGGMPYRNIIDIGVTVINVYIIILFVIKGGSILKDTQEPPHSHPSTHSGMRSLMRSIRPQEGSRE